MIVVFVCVPCFFSGVYCLVCVRCVDALFRVLCLCVLSVCRYVLCCLLVCCVYRMDCFCWFCVCDGGVHFFVFNCSSVCGCVLLVLLWCRVCVRSP